MKIRGWLWHTASFIGAMTIGIIVGTLINASFVELREEDPLSMESVSPPPKMVSPTSLLTEYSKARIAEMEALTSVPAVQRILWLAAQVENARPADMGHLLQLAEGNRELQKAIAYRWAEIDPVHMFESDYGKDLFAGVLLNTWSKSDPRGALESVQAWQAAGGERHSLGPTLLSYLMRNEPEIGIEAMNTLRAPHMLPTANQVAEWAATNPSAAAEKVAMMNTHAASLEAMGEVGKIWGTRDPEDAIEFGATLRNRMGYKLAEAAIASWAEGDPEAASKFATAQDDPVFRARLGQGLAAGIAKSDPAVAMNWAEENLQSTARAEAVGSIVTTLANDDIQAAANLVAGMNPGGAMNRAVDELIRVWGKTDSIDVLATDNRLDDAMFLWIGGIQDADTRHRAIQALQWRLETGFENGLIDFVSGEHGHLATEEMLNHAARQREREVGEAFD